MPSYYKNPKALFAHPLRKAVSAALWKDWLSADAKWRHFEEYRKSEFRKAAISWGRSPLGQGLRTYGDFAIQPWIGEDYTVGGLLIVLREYPLSVSGHAGAALDEWITCREIDYISEQHEKRGQYTTLRRALSLSMAINARVNVAVRFESVPSAGITSTDARVLARQLAVTDLVKLFAPFDKTLSLPIVGGGGQKSGSRHSDGMYDFASKVFRSELETLAPSKVVFLGAYAHSIRLQLARAVQSSGARALFLPHPQARVSSWRRPEGFSWE